MFPTREFSSCRTPVPTLSRWTSLVLLLAVTACEEDKTLGAPLADEAQSTGSAPSSAAVAAMGTIPLPVNQGYGGNGTAFRISHFGTGTAAHFDNTSSNLNTPLLAQSFSTNTLAGALRAENLSRGPAGIFFISSSTNTQPAIDVTTLGSGSAGRFRITNSSSSATVLTANTVGRGMAAFLRIQNSASPFAALQSQTNGTGSAVFGLNTGSGPAGRFEARGTGLAGEFIGTTNGVTIRTNSGGLGLQVVGGSKNAIVGTATGARELYSEEATEVWFSDYGFGRLENGRARVLLDAGFAQTVSLDQPYHVFVQPYGRAELYVEERTPLGFVVQLKDGDPSAEFGYRVIAKRAGFENRRLERAPWADGSFH